MADRTVYIMRHGRTEWNAERRIQGRKDSPLLPESLEVARDIASFLQTQEIQSIFTSPLLRAKNTAAIICGMLDVNCSESCLLLECDHGQCEGMTLDSVQLDMADFYAKREQDKWSVPWPDGEAYKDVFLRAEMFITNELPSGGQSLIIAHEVINKCITGALMGWPRDRIMKFKQNNRQLISVDGDILHVVEF